MRRTKIVCTIGPATSSKEAIAALVDAGMNVCRLNFSHGSYDEHTKVIEWVKEVRKEKGVPLGILLDTKGPEIRIGKMQDIEVEVGDIVTLTETRQQKNDIPIAPAHILEEIEEGATILIDDGYVCGKVVECNQREIKVRIEAAAKIKAGKGVNIPNCELSLPFITEKDREDIAFGAKMGVDMIAASFTMSAEHILTIKDLLEKEGAPETMVIAKIESRTGVDHFEKIVQVADGVMIARGDLGVEINIASVPHLQKWMIRECLLKSKPVIVATQMLESMIQNSRPTRAEASDVANSVFDGASAVMLSGETAVGKYPFEAVNVMHRVICETEEFFDYEGFFEHSHRAQFQDIPSGVALAAINTAYSLDAHSIFICSKGGHTIRRIAKYRPRAGIIAITPSVVTYHKTSLYWGTEAVMVREPDITRQFHQVACDALQRGWVKYGDLCVVTTGKPYFQSFTTNTIIVESIGEVILRGVGMQEEIAPFEAEVLFLLSGEKTSVSACEGKLIVITKYDDALKEHLVASKGIILQNHPHDSISEESLVSLYEERSIPFIYDCDGAMSLLDEGDEVRFDPSLGLVFKGKSPTKSEMLGNEGS